MKRRYPLCLGIALLVLGAGAGGAIDAGQAKGAGPVSWAGDLTPITAAEWSYDRAAHLLERAGFGGPPQEIAKLAAMSPAAAVSFLLDYESIDVSHLAPFEESDIYPNGYKFAGLGEVARSAMATGMAFGIPARREGELPLQPGVNEFYTLLWSDFGEINRAAQWWAERMLVTPRPLEERMALFWHDHFATSQAKIHRHRKMLRQIATLREHATGSFRAMLIAVSQDPAMLIWLDNKDNVKGHPNENYAREIMELFTMGEGQGYTETDIRELARAFTGWTLTPDATTEAGSGEFVNRPELHDDGEKSFLGRSGNFDGYAAIDIILEQPATPRFIAGKIYRELVREDLSPALNEKLALVLLGARYEIKPLLRTMLLSRDFYSAPAVGTQIKAPVHVIVSTYRKLGLSEIPGIPDFNELAGDLGQVLLLPPNVAGWPGHKTWINPATLLTRGNFVRTLLFPPDPADYEPPDKDIHPGYRKIPIMFPEYDITPYIWSNETQRMEPVSLGLYDKYLAGMDIEDAKQMMAKGEDDTKMTAKRPEQKSRMMSLAQGEQYNLAVGVYTGHVQANDRVKPIPRTVAKLDVRAMVSADGAGTVEEVVDSLLRRFLRVEIHPERRQAIVSFLRERLGGEEIEAAGENLETVLREVVHLVLSAPEYQLA